ncbi:MAG: amidinotransferase, partial [Chloroflexi bacterium]|nr:amidinotransferase [Chloroflexota bacterium]
MSEQDSIMAEIAYQTMHRNNPGKPEPAFETPEMLEKVWGRRWGLNNDVGKLQMVLVNRPEQWQMMLSGGEYSEEMQAWIGPDFMWYWADRNRPDIKLAQAQHDGLVAALQAEGVEVVHVQDPLPHMSKTIFTRDPAIMTKGGALVCRFGIDYRIGE